MVKRITVFKIIAKTIIVVLSAVIVFGVAGLYDFYCQIPTEPTANKEKTDAIIVLTGGSDRIAEGIRLLNEDYAPKVLISGVGKSTGKEKLLEEQKLPPKEAKQTDLSKIAVGYQAINTVGNARETADWVQANHIKSIRLVTGSYHMPRALVEFEKQMPDVVIIPNPVIPTDFHRNDWRNDDFTRKLILIEYTKYLMSKLDK